MEKYSGFENWLKATDHVSWNTYLSFMRQIEKALMCDLEKITSVSMLKKLMIDLENNRSFAARSYLSFRPASLRRKKRKMI
jgi:hypothetical protein